MKHILVRDVPDKLGRDIKRFALEEAAALGSAALGPAVKELCRRALEHRAGADTVPVPSVVRGDAPGGTRRGE